MPVKQNGGFRSRTHIYKGTWFITDESSQINNEWISYLIDCDGEIEKHRDK